MKKNADYWIKNLCMSGHPEGGYFKETFRGADMIKTGHLKRGYSGPRHAYTVIYYLLKSGQISVLHRLKSDELWDFYAGGPLTIYGIDPQGRYFEKKLGPDPEKAESFLHLVPAGCWFGAAVDNKDTYTLVGCFVSPGFDYQDYELAEREKLLAEYPQHREMIEKMTHEAFT
ncbi:cupin domain-containing protein [candidate division KSB1 bacterium]|nr:cupin domain-containing protein [candidate division KSB1 bacterium]